MFGTSCDNLVCFTYVFAASKVQRLGCESLKWTLILFTLCIFVNFVKVTPHVSIAPGMFRPFFNKAHVFMLILYFVGQFQYHWHWDFHCAKFHFVKFGLICTVEKFSFPFQFILHHKTIFRFLNLTFNKFTWRALHENTSYKVDGHPQRPSGVGL